MADAVFVYQGAEFESDAQISINEGRVLISDTENRNLAVIFDGTKDAFRLLDHEEKSYLDISTAFARSMLQGVQALVPQLQTLSEGVELSDDQKEMLQRLVEGQSGSDDGTPPTLLTTTDQTRTVHGLTCNVHKIETPTAEFDVCTIAYSTIGLGEQDRQTLEQLSGVFADLASSVQLHEAQQLASVIGQLDGVMLEANDASGKMMMRLKKLTLTDMDDADFIVPADYTPTDLFSILSGL